MSLHDTYLELNWPLLNEHGLSFSDDILGFNSNARNFIRSITCPFTLSIIMYMVIGCESIVFHTDQMFNRLFPDNRGNWFVFETVVNNLLESEMISIVIPAEE